MKDKIAILDIETVGGFTASSGFIVEIGITELNLKTFEALTVFESVCKHPKLTSKHHDSWIFKNSSLTVDMVREAPLLSEIQSEVQDIISQYKMGMASFNVKFDFPYMEGFGFKFGKIQPDPMLVLTPIMKLPNRKGWKNFKWPSVTEAYTDYLGVVDYEEEHRAGPDSLDEARLVGNMIDRGDYKVEY